VDEYVGWILAGRYRLPRTPADEREPMETRAFDTYSGQEVLVRQLLLPEVAKGEPGADADDCRARRALEAARAAAAIPDHPSLVQVFDVFTEGGSLWVVSELVPARPVATIIAERRLLSSYRTAEIAADVLGGLRALHVRGWAHRNITARTVLVCDDGRAMLDGLALGAAQEALCAAPAAPAAPAADLRALGSLLYRCVQGHPPFPEESAAEGCGPLRPVVESLLRQDPAERLRSEELRGWLRSLVRAAPEPEIGSRTVRMPASDPRTLPAVQRRSELVMRLHRRRRSRRLGVWLLGLILVALLAFLV
jgi:serine/threonine protein kinase